MRNLVLVLGDQLDDTSAAFDGFDRNVDVLWMAEAEEELVHVWCHKLRIAFFLSAMRHFHHRQKANGIQVLYHQLGERAADDAGPDFCSILAKDVQQVKPTRLIVVEPGDYRVRVALEKCASSLNLPLEVRPDRHFYCTVAEFAGYAKGKKLVLEHFYQYMRKKHKVLVDGFGRPTGGSWNYDKQNRERLQLSLVEQLKPKSFSPDQVTTEVLDLVAQRFANHPGSLHQFELAVTREEALSMLESFVEHALPSFGPVQDAMAVGQPFLYHSRLSALLNVKLLNPRECIEAAIRAYQRKTVALNSVEGFIRQILGWREFVRGIYWLEMPAYAERNFFHHEHSIPDFFWTGATDMHCVRNAMENVIANGYAHHIQRLMVLGLFALLYGVHPRRFHEWHMAMYIDAIDWVSLPNALGMSQFADGGLIATKPYCASGNYIQRMSDYCGDCRYDPKQATGDSACPFTTLYYDFLDRHFNLLKSNARLKFQLVNIERKRKDSDSMQRIREQANALHARWKS